MSGKDHPWLVEHIEYGLPKEKDIEKILHTKKVAFQKFFSKQLPLWELLTTVEFYASCNHYEKVEKELHQFNEYYNSTVFPYDFGEPSYRKVYYVRIDEEKTSSYDQPKQSIPPELHLELMKRISEILSAIHVTRSTQWEKLLVETQTKD